LRSSIFSFGVEIGIGVSATYINGIQNQNILATVSRTIPLVRSHVRGGQETRWEGVVKSLLSVLVGLLVNFVQLWSSLFNFGQLCSTFGQAFVNHLLITFHWPARSSSTWFWISNLTCNNLFTIELEQVSKIDWNWFENFRRSFHCCCWLAVIQVFSLLCRVWILPR
jgi:hypothetical protein